MIPPTWIAIAILSAALSGAGWFAVHQTEGKAVAEAAVKDAQAAGDAWRLALDQQTAYTKQLDAKLAASTAGYDALRRTTDRRIRDYENDTRTDSGTATWDSMPVPAAVARRLCEYTDKNPGAPRLPASAAAVHGPAQDPGACQFTTGDAWRWTEQLIEVIDRANEDRAAIR